MTGADELHESLHGAHVGQLLRRRIGAAGGWLGFDQYMRIALYEPGLGYYSAGARKLGMSDAEFGELMAVVGMFNQTNKLVEGYQVQVDERIRRFVQGEDGKGPLPREASEKASAKPAKRAAARRADAAERRKAPSKSGRPG